MHDTDWEVNLPSDLPVDAQWEDLMPTSAPIQSSSEFYEQNRSDLSGVNLNFGLTFRGGITENLELHGSLTHSPDYNLSSRNSRTFASVVINPTTQIEFPVNEINVDLESIGLDKTDLSMPSVTSFGFGISKPKKWFIAAEYTSITSSVFSNDLISIENSEFEDSSKICK